MDLDRYLGDFKEAMFATYLAYIPSLLVDENVPENVPNKVSPLVTLH
jgi:hypothetical protein